MFRTITKLAIISGLALGLPALASAKAPRVYKSVAWTIKAKIAQQLNTKFHKPAKPWVAKDVKVRTKRLPWTGRIGGPTQRNVTFKAAKLGVMYAGKVRALTPLNPTQKHMTSLGQIAFTLQPRGLVPPPAAR